MIIGSALAADVESFHPWGRIRKHTVKNFRLSDFSDEVVSGFRLMVEKVRVAQNDMSSFVGSDVTTKIPPDVLQRTEHFCWLRKRWQRKLMSSAWIVPSEHDERNFTLLMEKFSALDPSESLDDVWRVTGSDWTVTFLSTNHVGQLDNDQFISLDYEVAMGLPKRLYNATLFSLDNEAGFMTDVLQWKLTMET